MPKKNIVLPLITMIFTSCNDLTNLSQIELEINDYVMASCLVHSDDPVIQEQGEIWAEGILQSSNIKVSNLTQINESVKIELKQDGIQISRPNRVNDRSTLAWVASCAEMRHKENIKREIKSILKHYL
ncbi:MAG: hypothetical protein ACFB2Z_14655 [Maricaulaceae bacterium]